MQSAKYGHFNPGSFTATYCQLNNLRQAFRVCEKVWFLKGPEMIVPTI